MTFCPPEPNSPFVAVPCPPGGAGGPEFDVEQNILCDVGPDGEILGTALAVYEYDEATGNPVLPPKFVDPITGLPYVAQGTLMPCPGDAACMQPIQFCFQSSAPVNQPGRQYDLTFNIAQGFNVQSVLKDAVEIPLNITWGVTDPNGATFATDLQTALTGQFPGSTVTVTPPAITSTCGDPETFLIHIECLRLDQNPPGLVQLKYNAGKDLIQNPGYNQTPPIDFHTAPGSLQLLKRQDNGGTLDCTNVANRGWETNDIRQSFELWNSGPTGATTTQNVTPTPRGTPVQEINALGSGPETFPGSQVGTLPDTIWQTFTVPVAGNFNIRLVAGGRDRFHTNTPDTVTIKLSTGDVNDLGGGDIINTPLVVPSVVSNNNPWTTFNQVVPLAAGTYTLALTGPVDLAQVPATGNSFGGLFTDMRVFQDAPNTLAPFSNNDTTCVVPVTETSTICEFWTPICGGGEITGWRNTSDGELLSNAQFWAQVPAPTCCSSDGSGGGSSSVGNLANS